MYKNNTQRKYVPLTGVSEDVTIYVQNKRASSDVKYYREVGYCNIAKVRVTMASRCW